MNRKSLNPYCGPVTTAVAWARMAAVTGGSFTDSFARAHDTVATWQGRGRRQRRRKQSFKEHNCSSIGRGDIFQKKYFWKKYYFGKKTSSHLSPPHYRGMGHFRFPLIKSQHKNLPDFGAGEISHFCPPQGGMSQAQVHSITLKHLPSPSGGRPVLESYHFKRQV